VPATLHALLHVTTHFTTRTTHFLAAAPLPGGNIEKSVPLVHLLYKSHIKWYFSECVPADAASPHPCKLGESQRLRLGFRVQV
jgi:hypothetical protein